jgi:hypothetical protein
MLAYRLNEYSISTFALPAYNITHCFPYRGANACVLWWEGVTSAIIVQSINFPRTDESSDSGSTFDEAKAICTRVEVTPGLANQETCTRDAAEPYG